MVDQTTQNATTAEPLNPRQTAIYNLIRPVLADRLAVEEDRVLIDTHFINDLEADSLDLVTVIMELEELFKKYNLKITDEEATEIPTTRAAVLFLDKKLPSDAAEFASV